MAMNVVPVETVTLELTLNEAMMLFLAGLVAIQQKHHAPELFAVMDKLIPHMPEEIEGTPQEKKDWAVTKRYYDLAKFARENSDE